MLSGAALLVAAARLLSVVPVEGAPPPPPTLLPSALRPSPLPTTTAVPTDTPNLASPLVDDSDGGFGVLVASSPVPPSARPAARMSTRLSVVAAHAAWARAGRATTPNPTAVTLTMSATRRPSAVLSVTRGLRRYRTADTDRHGVRTTTDISSAPTTVDSPMAVASRPRLRTTSLISLSSPPKPRPRPAALRDDRGGRAVWAAPTASANAATSEEANEYYRWGRAASSLMRRHYLKFRPKVLYTRLKE